MKDRIMGIMGAMPEEVNGIINLLTDKEEFQLGKRSYFVGKLNGIKTVAVFSRWGKVAATTTVSTLILKFNVSEIIFTGVAGAINPDLNVGDIIIGKRLIQHDLDGRPLLEEFEIPLLGVRYIDIQTKQLEIATKAVQDLINGEHLFSVITEAELQQFGIIKPKLMIGDIASGDKFFASVKEKEKLLNKLPATLCVEMEGAAVAQVCYEYGIPFTVLRTISDTADEKSHIDFSAFIEKVSNKYSIEIVKNIFNQISQLVAVDKFS
jgi:adenosylhomocysteine nucleosidase